MSCRAWLLALAALACLKTEIASSNEPVERSARADAWREVLAGRQFHLSVESLGIKRNLRHYSADSKLRIVFDPARRSGLEFVFSCKNDDEIQIDGHVNSAFASVSDRLYFGKYRPNLPGCTVIAYNLNTGEKLWETALHHAQPGGATSYANFVKLRMSNAGEIRGGIAGDAIIVSGSESFCDYTEVLDSHTGESLALKNYRVGFGGPERNTK